MTPLRSEIKAYTRHNKTTPPLSRDYETKPYKKNDKIDHALGIEMQKKYLGEQRRQYLSLVGKSKVEDVNLECIACSSTSVGAKNRCCHLSVVCDTSAGQRLMGRLIVGRQDFVLF